MREYQSLIILNAKADEAKLEAFKQKFEKIISQAKAQLIQFENLGKRELATYFDKNTNGVFLRVTYQSGPELPNEIARLVRNDEEALRVMTVLSSSLFQKDKQLA